MKGFKCWGLECWLLGFMVKRNALEVWGLLVVVQISGFMGFGFRV
jgi:hypothetical protein